MRGGHFVFFVFNKSCAVAIVPFVLLIASMGCDVDGKLPNSEGELSSLGPDGGVAVVTSGIRFQQVAESDIRADYRNGFEAGHHAILESLGGGVGVGDFDGDRDLDVFIPRGGGFSREETIAGLASQVYFNDGDFRFRDVTSGSFVDVAYQYSHGSNIGDFDNDGFVDVLVTGYGALVLWQNLGDGTFVEVASRFGFADSLWSSSSGWGDFNADGVLDLYVAHYANWSWMNHPMCAGVEPAVKEVCPPRRFEALPDTVFVSGGDGQFSDGSEVFGLRVDGKGLGVVVADFDLDGDVDVYVGNDTVANFYYRNEGGRFEDVGLLSGTALSDRGTPDGSMGVDVGDLTGDGLLDIWVANYESESIAIYRNQGRGFYQHVSQQMGVTAVGALFVGWGAILLDLDRDGDLDAFVSNGHVVRHPVNAPVKQRPLVFENLSSKRFVDVALLAGEYASKAHEGRGCASGDLDGDGDLDVIVSRLNAPVAVLANESVANGDWIAMRLIGTVSNRDAVGASVRMRLRSGRVIVSQVKSGSSFASTSDRTVFFGVPAGDEVRNVDVLWPSGKTSSHLNLVSNATHTLIER